MESQNTLLWIISIVAVVGIVAMVVAVSQTRTETYSVASSVTGASQNIGGDAVFTSCLGWKGNTRICTLADTGLTGLCTFDGSGRASCSGLQEKPPESFYSHLV